MEQRLTARQVDQAKKYLALATDSAPDDACIIRLAGILQYAPPQYDEDVVEAMLDAYYPDTSWRNELHSSVIESMCAALGVVLDRVCAPVTDEEWDSQKHFVALGMNYLCLTRQQVDTLMESRRASLLKPAKPTIAQEMANLLFDYEGLSQAQRKAIGEIAAELFARRTA